VYIYSGVHSVTIWVTVGAVMLAMLTLAKERIVSSMRTTIVRGRTLITILATIITLTVTVITLWFVLQFARRFTGPPTATTAPAAIQARP
jgi:heme/copper-type cytochrome/quinol oxidase subunit 2